jgi:hypothetical protein
VRRSVIAFLTFGVAVLSFAVPAVAVDSFFDIFTDLPVEGVAPLPPLTQAIGHQVAGGFLHELGHSISLVHGAAGGGAPIPLDMMLSNGAPPGPDNWTPNSISVMDYDYQLAGGAPYPADSFFDINYAIDIPGGGPAHLVPIQPGQPDPFFDVFVGDSFFDITYRVEVGPGGGCHELHMHGVVQPALHIHSNSLNVQHPSSTVDSFFDVFFELDLVEQEINTSEALVTVTTTGQYLTLPLAAQAATWGAVKSLYRQ